MKALTFALLGMAFWGIAPLFGKLGLTNVPPSIALAMRSIVITSILVTWLLASGQHTNLANVTSRDWLFIGLEGIFASLLGHLAYYYALKTGEVSRVTPVMAGFPIVTAILAILFLNEKFTPGKLLGALLVVLGVFLIKR